MNLNYILRRLRLPLQCVVLMAVVGAPAGAATNVVTSLADSGPGSLRQAISDALPGNTIIFSVNGTIALTSGELSIQKSLSIVGPGATNLAVSGSFSSRVFNISAVATSSISAITIRDGRTSNGSQPGEPGGDGGGIHNLGALTLDNCIITGNATGRGGNGTNGNDGANVNPGGAAGTHGSPGGNGGSGGGIYNLGKLVVNQCIFIANRTGDGGTGGDGGKGGSGSQAGGAGGDAGKAGFGGYGGAILSVGELAIAGSSFLSNATGNGGSASTGGRPGTGRGVYYGWPGSGASGGTGGGGGAAWNERGLLTAAACVFSSNSCGQGGVSTVFLAGLGADSGPGGPGGGIGNNGSVLLSNCTIIGNVAGKGGVANVEYSSSRRGGNGGDGGGILNVSNFIAVGSTFVGNKGGNGGQSGMDTNYSGEGGWGGGIANDGSSAVLVLSNCTVSENSAGLGFRLGKGGGINSETHSKLLSLVACTVSSNRASEGGGIRINQRWTPTNTAFIQNSLIAGNWANSNSTSGSNSATDLWGHFISGGKNLIGDGCCFTNVAAGDVIGTTNAPIDPMIGPLADNGGPTFTHALLPGSPALNAGDDTLTGTDQRGRPRLSGAHVDIGAFEFTVPMPQSPGLRWLTNGTSQFSFTTFSDVSFRVLATTNVSMQSTQWFNLGPATLITNGLYEFTEPLAASNRHRFFQLRWP